MGEGDYSVTNDELKTIIHKMIDAISENRMLVMIYTFIKYLR